MLDWLIIGGGLHGSHLALVLRQRLGVAAADMRVVDDAPAPFAVWRQRVAACEMNWLRSPQAHHLGLRSDSLRTLAAREGWEQPFIPPYKRPSTALFDLHCDEVAQASGLEQMRAWDQVVHVEALADGYRAHGQKDVWDARRVLLATGPPPPRRDAWAHNLPHVFDADFDRRTLSDKSSVAVVGGGLSAGHLALALAAEGRQVRVIAPHLPRQANFDSRPCYAGPRCLGPFLENDWNKRRQLINQARNPGTLPQDLMAELQRHREGGSVQWIQGRATGIDEDGLQLEGGRHCTAGAVVLATGFMDHRPGGALVDQLIADLELPLSPCGYPALDASLQWQSGLFVTGRLAELELGPMAGNIRGARLAGERLQGFMQSH